MFEYFYLNNKQINGKHNIFFLKKFIILKNEALQQVTIKKIEEILGDLFILLTIHFSQQFWIKGGLQEPH